MTQRCFFATADDLKDLLGFVFAEPGLVVYEAYSRPDQPLRTFHKLPQLLDAFPDLGREHVLLRIWSKSVGAPPEPRRFELNPEAVPGFSHRHVIEDMALMQIDLPKQDEPFMRHATLSHFNEAGAKAKFGEAAAAYDWAALRKASGRIQRHISRHLAVAKVANIDVLPGAMEQVAQGACLLVWGQRIYSSSPELIPLPGQKSRATTAQSGPEASDDAPP